MKRVTIGILALAVLTILFVVLCTFVKRPYERVLLIRFGNIIEEKDQVNLAYNWFFKMPTDSVERVDTRLHLYTGPLQQMNTAGSEPISVQTFAAWRITDPVKFYRTMGGSDVKAQSIIDQKIAGLVREKIAGHALDEIFNTDPAKVHTESIESEIATGATRGDGKTSGVTDQGMEIVQVGFSRMAFPPANAEPVYQRMAAERMTQAMAYISEGRSKADAIRAQGSADAKEIKAKATAEAEQTRGEGDREALKILADVQQSNSAREFYQYWKSMDFVKSAFTKNTYLVLGTNSDILRSLFTAPVNGQYTPTNQPAPAPSPQKMLPETPAGK